MTVYEVMQRMVAREDKEAREYAEQYVDRLLDNHRDAGVSAMLSRRAFQNAAALRIMLEGMSVDVAEREI
jgi:hypothetical protein